MNKMRLVQLVCFIPLLGFVKSVLVFNLFYWYLYPKLFESYQFGSQQNIFCSGSMCSFEILNMDRNTYMPDIQLIFGSRN